MKFIVSAEHTKGKSVGHPCVDGVYDDPTDSFELEWEIDDATGIPTVDLEERAERAGWVALMELAEHSEPCKCRRRLSPGSSAWVDSVAICVKQVEPARSK